MPVQTSKVLEQILAVLIQFVKDKKLEHQHQYVRLFMLLLKCYFFMGLVLFLDVCWLSLL